VAGEQKEKHNQSGTRKIELSGQIGGKLKTRNKFRSAFEEQGRGDGNGTSRK
jgi:hypothetical protein